MQALYWDGNRIQFNAAYPTPVIDDHTALVRVHLAGICSTDLQIFQGYMGFQGVPGHECVGEVYEGPAEWQGQRVVSEINFACGQCASCVQGLGRHCPTRRVMGILHADGAFAEYVAVPTANLHRVPDDISDEEAVFAEPLAAAYEILAQVAIAPTDSVLVLGDGKLGLLCAQVMQTTGASVHVVGRHPRKLALVQQLGIQTQGAQDALPHLFDVVIEATGSDQGLQRAIEAVRPRGTLVLKSTVAAEHTLSLAPLVINEITVVGSRCGLFPPALDALQHHRVAVTPLITETYALRHGSEAVAHAQRPGTLKILLRPT